jgi:hypothetical protein
VVPLSLLGVCQLLTSRGEQLREIAPTGRLDAQVLDRVAPLGDRPRGHANGFVEALLGLFRAPGKHVARGLHLDQRSLEALQERVMQLACDARPFFKLHVECLHELMQTDPVDSAYRRHEREHGHRPEPPGSIPWRQNTNVQRGAALGPIPAACARLNLQCVKPRWKCRIGRDAAIAFRLIPFQFESHQSISVLGPGRIDITEAEKSNEKMLFRGNSSNFADQIGSFDGPFPVGTSSPNNRKFVKTTGGAKLRSITCFGKNAINPV